jgi:hypothetical protein
MSRSMCDVVRVTCLLYLYGVLCDGIPKHAVKCQWCKGTVLADPICGCWLLC